MTTLKKLTLTIARTGLILAMTAGLDAQQGETQPNLQTTPGTQGAVAPAASLEEQKARQLEKYDLNRNGKIDVEERPGYVKERVNLLRALQREKAEQRRRLGSSATPEPKRYRLDEDPALLAGYDKNGNGRLDPDEWRAAPRERIKAVIEARKQVNKDKNGAR